MGFSITSPGLDQLERVFGKADLGKIVYLAANDVAHGGLIDGMHAAAKAGGASDDLLSDIGSYLEDGEVRVGVASSSPNAAEAFELEYGSAVGAPVGWMRGTLARGKHSYSDAFGTALAARLFSEAGQ